MKPKVLVVDDDDCLLDILKLILKDAGFEVFTAQDEEEFLKEALQNKPDILILDIMLGEKDGTVSYQKLLAQGFSKKVPVIFLTALAKDENAIPPQPGRTYALMPKPFNYDKLVEGITSLVNS